MPDDPDVVYIRGRYPEPIGPQAPLDDTVMIRVEEQFDVRPGYAAHFSREVSKAVADLAMEQLAEARDKANTALRLRLESMRQGLVTAVQERLSAYVAECKRLERDPLTWDLAHHAVGAMLEELEREHRY